MSLIQRSAFFKTCGCGECWGTIVLADGNRGLLVVSKQEARTSLLRAVELGLLSKEERMVIEMQIDMSDLHNSAENADQEIRFRISVANLHGVKQMNDLDEPLTALGIDAEEVRSNIDPLTKGSFEDYLRELFSSDKFDRNVQGEDPNCNPEGLPIC